MATLRAVIVMDYQNVHLTGYEMFGKDQGLATHEALVHPLHFAHQLIHTRNQAQRPGADHAELSRILVYRGEPHADHDPKPYAWNQAQKAEWERDQRVRVHMRPLKYLYEYDANGGRASGPDGKAIVRGKKEKGIDVLCALAVVREARRPDVDVVILASHDTDLIPALDEVYAINVAKIETFSWYDTNHRRQLRLTDRTRALWNTRLGATEFDNSRDRTKYD